MTRIAMNRRTGRLHIPTLATLATLAVVAVLAVGTATLGPFAAAHSQLERTVPAAGSAVRASPERLTLWFSQKFEPAFTRVRVLDVNGKQVDNADAQVGGDDARQLSVSLPKLAPGTYRVHWRVLSTDTHVSEGQFAFDVRP
jgi:methionine-rich copper-binding protein CopC